MNDMRKLIDTVEKLTEETDIGPSGLDTGYFKVFVNTHGDPEDSWATNAMKYDTVEEAEEAAENLFMRWTAVNKWRVMDADKQTTYAEGP